MLHRQEGVESFLRVKLLVGQEPREHAQRESVVLDGRLHGRSQELSQELVLVRGGVQRLAFGEELLHQHILLPALPLD